MARPHQVNTIKDNTAFGNGGGVGQQPHDRQGQGTLASAALTHDAVNLALFLGKGYPIQGLYLSRGGLELYPEIFNS